MVSSHRPILPLSFSFSFSSRFVSSLFADPPKLVHLETRPALAGLTVEERERGREKTGRANGDNRTHTRPPLAEKSSSSLLRSPKSIRRRDRSCRGTAIRSFSRGPLSGFSWKAHYRRGAEIESSEIYVDWDRGKVGRLALGIVGTAGKHATRGISTSSSSPARDKIRIGDGFARLIRET